MPDISPSIMPGAEMIYRISSEKKGVLLLHGYLGSPFEMKSMAEGISQAGYSVYVPRYPGHGTTIEEVADTDGADWFHSAREAYLELRALCRDVHVVGLSMGALFAVLLAREFEIPGIALLSMPAGIPGGAIYLTPVLKYFKKVLYFKEKQMASLNRGINNPEARAVHVGYFQGIPVAQSWELHRLIRKAMAALPAVHARTLLVQSREDDVIPPSSMDSIARCIGSTDLEILWLEKSNHAITVDYEKEIVTAKVLSFIDGE